MAESSNRFIALDKCIWKVHPGTAELKDSSKNDSKKGFKEGNYAVSIIDDKEFYQARKCLETWSKQLTKKQGKGKKSNAAEAITDDDVNILYEKYLH